MIFVCLTVVQSSQSLDDASRARIERGLKYIKEQDAARARLFKTNSSDANILNYTQNIYILFKDPEKVSLVHGASHEEKEAIFKVIMASAIIHAPEAGADYPRHLDFYENKIELLEAVFAVLNPHRVEIVRRDNLAKNLLDFISNYNMNDVAGVKSADPYFCHVYDLFDENGQSLLHKFNSLVKHFEISIALNRFAKAVVKSFENGSEMNDGQFANCEMLLNDSGMNIDTFFECFMKTFEYFYPDHAEQFANYLIKTKALYNNYLSDQKSINGMVDLHEVSEGDELTGNLPGIYFTLEVVKAVGDGTCGYHSLGVSREQYMDFLKRNPPDEESPEMKNFQIVKLQQWLNTEDIEYLSKSSILSDGKSSRLAYEGRHTENRGVIWNQQPLNDQVICVWTHNVPGSVKLFAAYYNGNLISALQDRIILNQVVEKGKEFLPIDFTQELTRLVSEGKITHLYNNGHTHYDNLQMKSVRLLR